jgi:O-acetyl-ADP-ribose deacetylase (regulator of RNase III)
MIKEVSGDIFESGADILVNAVNCVGVMGAGVAFEFKNRYPAYFDEYKRACYDRVLEPGFVMPYMLEEGKYIISAATKDHWQSDSKYGWVESCIEGLYSCFDPREVRYGNLTLALPALGCGKGGLKYEIVGPMIMHVGKRLPYKEVLLYKPL